MSLGTNRRVKPTPSRRSELKKVAMQRAQRVTGHTAANADGSVTTDWSARPRLALIVALIFLATGSISPRAQADPLNSTTHTMAEYVVQYGPAAVCKGLDAQPSLDGVAATVAGVTHDGWTWPQAAQMVLVSVDFYCPGHDALVRGYFSTNAPGPVAAGPTTFT
jgi:hypothetical protein